MLAPMERFGSAVLKMGWIVLTPKLWDCGRHQTNLEKINHHGKRADAIVKGMLQDSPTNNGIKEPTNINALADEYLRLSYHGLRAKDKSFHAEFRTDLDPTLPKINIMEGCC